MGTRTSGTTLMHVATLEKSGCLPQAETDDVSPAPMDPGPVGGPGLEVVDWRWAIPGGASVPSLASREGFRPAPSRLGGASPPQTHDPAGVRPGEGRSRAPRVRAPGPPVRTSRLPRDPRRRTNPDSAANGRTHGSPRWVHPSGPPPAGPTACRAARPPRLRGDLAMRIPSPGGHLTTLARIGRPCVGPLGQRL